jgi:alkylhydroperoxidase family enzyme
MAVVEMIEQPDTEELKEMYERLAQAGLGLGVLNIFKAMAHNPKLLRDWVTMATPLLTGSLMLSPRLRELAILRVGQVSGSEYEFGQHIRIARMAGVSYEEMAALKKYEDGDHFSELERAVIAYTDECARLDAGAADRARDLKRWLSDRELLELTFCIGHWSMVARVLVPLEVELDEALLAELPDEWRQWL